MDLEEELRLERQAIEEQELEAEERPLLIPRQRPKLKRDLRAEALERMEEAARSEEDFLQVTTIWDRLEQNRMRRERDHEVSRGDIPLEYGSVPEGSLFPRWMSNPKNRACARGDFLNLIFDCPFELHEMVSSGILSGLLRELKEEYKELLYYLVIHDFSTECLGHILEMSDRNVRKKRMRLLERLQGKLYRALQDKPHLTTRERRFVSEYEKAAPGRSGEREALDETLV